MSVSHLEVTRRTSFAFDYERVDGRLHFAVDPANPANARITDLDREAAKGRGRRVDAETLLLCLAPFAPHITEELWQRTGHEESVHARGGWPEHDPALAARLEVEVAVQVNGKLRGTLTVPAGTAQDELRQRALELPRIAELLDGAEPRKVVVVVDRVVNLVV